jgi:cytochrome b561
MRLGDSQNGCGWISIVPHWTTAIIILVICVIGNSIAVAEGLAQDELILLNTTIAILAYALLWLRVLWRLFKGIGALLVSGPLIAWSGDIPIRAFDWLSIPAPLGMNAGLFSAAHTVHLGAATVVIIGATLHIGGVIKHVAFNRDGTFAKMMLAARWSSATATE